MPLSARIGTIWLGGRLAYSSSLQVVKMASRSYSVNLLRGTGRMASGLLSASTTPLTCQFCRVRILMPTISQALPFLAP